MTACFKPPYLLAQARKMANALRNELPRSNPYESEEAAQKRRKRIAEEGALILDMLANEFERVVSINNQLGSVFDTPKRAQSSFSLKRRTGVA